MIEYPTKVLLATDGAADSTKAARLAATLATSAGAALHVVHVGRVAGASEVGATATHPPLPGEPPGYSEQQARRLLERQVRELESAGGTVTEAHLRIGPPGPTVVALARELGADLLVVGSGGPHRMRRAVATTTRRSALGKVSDAIVRTAHCPVLVVRGEGASGETGMRSEEDAR